MEKQFQEVFPDLRIEGGMAELLDTVEVSRVSINKKKDLLRIYVVSHQWIHKKYIYQLERQIEEQLFSNVPLRVKIIERFYLSRQYTPENPARAEKPQCLSESSVFDCRDYLPGDEQNAPGARGLRCGKGARGGAGPHSRENLL